MSLSQILDHAARARARLVTQFRSSVSHAGLLNAFSTQVQAIEDALFGTFAAKAIETAEGSQLDAIGRKIGQPRDALDDVTYRSFLHARIKLNASSGTGEDLLEILTLLLSNYSANVITLDEQYPAGIVLRMAGALTAPIAALLAIMRGAQAAGVRLILEWSEYADAASFTFTATSPPLASILVSNVAPGDSILPVGTTNFANWVVGQSVVIDPDGFVGTEVFQIVGTNAIDHTLDITPAVLAFAHVGNTKVFQVDLSSTMGLGPSTGGHFGGAL